MSGRRENAGDSHSASRCIIYSACASQTQRNRVLERKTGECKNLHRRRRRRRRRRRASDSRTKIACGRQAVRPACIACCICTGAAASRTHLIERGWRKGGREGGQTGRDGRSRRKNDGLDEEAARWQMAKVQIRHAAL